jgi:hypothetical protein
MGIAALLGTTLAAVSATASALPDVAVLLAEVLEKQRRA